MKIKVELELEDALSLCTLFVAVMEIGGQNIGNDPILYSNLSRITNDFQNQVIAKTPLEELEKIKANPKI